MDTSPVISVEKIAEFAKRKYANQRTVFDINLYTHAVAVARQAEVIAQRVYRDMRKDYLSESPKDSISNVVHSALLHDVLNVSACAFEHIAEITSVQIATIVADISRDFRLIETKRDLEFRGRLSQSTLGAQIVVVADIICTTKELLQFLSEHGLVAVSRAKKILSQLDGDLLALHATNRYYVLRLYAHAARNLIGDASRAIKECKQQAKIDRVVAKATKTMRTKKIAAKKKVKAAGNLQSTARKKKRTDK